MKIDVHLAEVAGATFVVAFLSTFSFSNLSTWHDAAIAGATAASSVVVGALKGFLSK